MILKRDVLASANNKTAPHHFTLHEYQLNKPCAQHHMHATGNLLQDKASVSLHICPPDYIIANYHKMDALLLPSR